MQVLDVGCGTFPYQPREGEAVVGVDFREYVKPTIVHDLNNFPYPLDDNMFDKVYASHVMEHLTDHIRFMEEIYRVSKSNAEIIIRVPHFSGRSAWCDPTHLRAYSYYQFHYFDADFRDHYGNCDFTLESVRLNWTRFQTRRWYAKLPSAAINALANLSPAACERIWCYWVGGFSEAQIRLRARK